MCDEAERAGRDPARLTPALQLWCQFDEDADAARAALAPAIEAFYRVPFARFEPYCIAGDAPAWRRRLQMFVDAGVRHFNLIPAAGEVGVQLAQIAEQVLPAFR